MKNANEMTLDECIEEMMTDEGWVRTENFTGEVRSPAKAYCHEPPCSPTLECAAAAMPAGWVWMRGMWGGRPAWIATRAGEPWVNGVSIDDTGDEMPDRFRLAVLCRLAEKEVRT
mgnify:FL=1